MSILGAMLMVTVAGPIQTADTSPHSQATLVSSVRTFKPGTPFLVAVRMKMDKGWHSYWKNPGDSGMATSIAWKLPKGWKAGPIVWPTPEVLGSKEVTSFGYDTEVLLLTRLTPPVGATGGKLQADVSWLICSESCVPAAEKVSLNLAAGTRVGVDPVWFKRLQLAELAAPHPVPASSASAQRSGQKIWLTVRDSAGFSAHLGKFRFFPSDEGILQHSAEQPATQGANGVRISLTVSEYARKTDRLRGILVPEHGFGDARPMRPIEIDVPIRPESSLTKGEKL